MNVSNQPASVGALHPEGIEHIYSGRHISGKLIWGFIPKSDIKFSGHSSGISGKLDGFHIELILKIVDGIGKHPFRFSVEIGVARFVARIRGKQKMIVQGAVSGIRFRGHFKVEFHNRPNNFLVGGIGIRIDRVETSFPLLLLSLPGIVYQNKQDKRNENTKRTNHCDDPWFMSAHRCSPQII